MIQDKNAPDPVGDFFAGLQKAWDDFWNFLSGTVPQTPSTPIEMVPAGYYTTVSGLRQVFIYTPAPSIDAAHVELVAGAGVAMPLVLQTPSEMTPDVRAWINGVFPALGGNWMIISKDAYATYVTAISPSERDRIKASLDTLKGPIYFKTNAPTPDELMAKYDIPLTMPTGPTPGRPTTDSAASGKYITYMGLRPEDYHQAVAGDDRDRDDESVDTQRHSRNSGLIPY